MGWGALAAVGGSIISGLISSHGQQSAASTQADAARDATQAERDMYNQTRADNLPALGARNDALARLEELLGVSGHGPGGIDPNKVLNEPGYQFGQQQGQAALDRSFNARGMRDSGAALKAAARYGTDYATTKYDAALNRELNPLQSLAGLGQSGANAIGAAGSDFASQAGANARYAGDAAANGALGQASIWGNTANQLAGWYQNRGGGSAWAGSGAGAGRGSSFGTNGLDQFFYGNGTSGD